MSWPQLLRYATYQSKSEQMEARKRPRRATQQFKNQRGTSSQPTLSGMPELAARAQLPKAHAQKLERVMSLGAVHVTELLATDWRSLVSFMA